MIGSSYILWENETYVIKTLFNPHIPYREGPHLIVAPKINFRSAWDDIEISTETFKLALHACAAMESLKFAPWFNIQANGNWGLLPDAELSFHVHIYGRKQTEHWGKPVTLPDAPDTYQNEPMPESDRSALIQALTAISAT